MGVSKLWEELEPAIHITSWTQLSEPGFAEAAGVRGLRVGIDLSAWLFHMQRMGTIVDAEGNAVNTGKNADIRMVFSRLCGLLSHGLLPFIVFDGPHRPSFKRGQRVGGNAFGGKNPQTLKTMFDCLGVGWRVAPGEAEAELAVMNTRGEIDSVLSDDVDSFLFGAQRVIRNTSKTLSSNKSKTALARTASNGPSASQPSQSQPSSSPFASQATLLPLPVDPSYKDALPSYSSSDILSYTGLGQDELILVALLAGGDYLAEGCRNFGNMIAVALAKAGYAKTLLDGVRRIWASSSSAGMSTFLEQWRLSVADELRTNRNKLFKTRHMKLADDLAAATDFPSLSVVDFYLHPRVSSPVPGERDYAPAPSFDKQIDLARTVAFCQRTFAWGNHECEAKMRSTVWRALGMQALRREALQQDGAALPPPPTSSKGSLLPSGWIAFVVEYKCAASTDYSPSYRVALNPSAFTPLVLSALPSSANDPHPMPDYSLLTPDEEAAVRAQRKADGQLQDKIKDPTTSSFRHWIGAGWAAVEGTEMEVRVREMWSEKERKEREKEEVEEAKRERARLRAAGVKSPRKKASGSASSPVKAAAKGKGKAKGKSRVAPSDMSSEGDEEGAESDDVRAAIEREKVRRAREALKSGKKDKGKEKEEVGRARTKSYLDDSDHDREEDDDLDDFFGLPVRPKASAKGRKPSPEVLSLSSSPGPDDNPAGSTSRSRRPPKTAASSSSSILTSAFPASKGAGTLTSAFTTSKMSVSAYKLSKPKPPFNPFEDDDDLFDLTSSPPAASSSLLSSTNRAPPPTSLLLHSNAKKPSTSPLKRPTRSPLFSPAASPPVASPTFSSTSEDDGQAKRKVGHVSKAGRGSREEKSPRKTRPAAEKGKGKGKNKEQQGVIDLCLSSDEEEEQEAVLASRVARKGGKKKEQVGEKKKTESLADMWARRQASQEQKQSEVIVVSDSE